MFAAESIEIRTNRQQIIGGFNGGEAKTRHHQCIGTLKAGDGGTHGSFELHHGGRVGEGGINGFAINDERQLGQAVGGLQHVAQRLQVEPQVVSVE